jgi:hypothetical protein
MLIGKEHSVRIRVAWTLLTTLGITAGGVLLVLLGSFAGLWAWPPPPSSPLGVACGLVGGTIILFEMAILPRKWLRGRRLGSTRRWMQFHVWLGLLCLPVILTHSGFGFGGPFTTVTLALFLVVIASGVWGLILQQWLPQKILADIPGETVASEVDFTGDYHAQEVIRLIAGLIQSADESAEGSHPAPAVARVAALHTQAGTGTGPVLTGQTAEDLRSFAAKLLLPYLRAGTRSRSPLVARAEVERWFARFRELTPLEARPALDRMEALCDLRRQWDLLVRLQFWLHNWLLVHLPLSVVMTGLVVVHVFRALKYW